MNMRAFTDHPASVNETYGPHLATSWSFAFPLLGAGLACLVHGLLPFAFTSTGSSIVRTLHDRMVTHRVRHKEPQPPLPGEST